VMLLSITPGFYEFGVQTEHYVELVEFLNREVLKSGSLEVVEPQISKERSIRNFVNSTFMKNEV
jgi:hypothetical protein